MGEIGINWHDYLYRLKYWQILLIGRGYLCRQHSGWEQARLVAYHAAHALGSKHILNIEDWITFPWENKNNEITNINNDDEIEYIRQRIIEENSKIDGTE